MRISSAGLGRKGRSSGQSSPTHRSGVPSRTNRFDSDRVDKEPLSSKVRSAAMALTEAPCGSLALSPGSRVSFASAEMSPPPFPGSVPLLPQEQGHQRSTSSEIHRMSSFQPTGDATVASNVQHAVAQSLKETLIAEWMWKSTPKRKSLGVITASGDKGSIRRKRWTWLSPHEQTVMWSSKQPRSETAWLGRKRSKA